MKIITRMRLYLKAIDKNIDRFIDYVIYSWNLKFLAKKWEKVVFVVENLTFFFKNIKKFETSEQ